MRRLPPNRLTAGLVAAVLSSLHVPVSAVPGDASTGADGNAGNQVDFIACPIYRDTDAGVKSGCWLATDPASGIRYEVTAGRSKPQWGREILVEGVVTAEPDTACGGVVLNPVRISVLPGECNKHMLPGEGYDGRKFQPPRGVMRQIWEARPVPEPPYGPRSYTIYFDFNSSFPLYQYSELIMEQASIYAKASHPRRVVVTGYAATTDYVVSGRVLREDMARARERAEKIGLSLQRLGVQESILEISWEGDAGPMPDGDEGLMEPSRRRAVISIEF